MDDRRDPELHSPVQTGVNVAVVAGLVYVAIRTVQRTRGGD